MIELMVQMTSTARDFLMQHQNAIFITATVLYAIDCILLFFEKP